jgi:hypothetical protein
MTENRQMYQRCQVGNILGLEKYFNFKIIKLNIT